MLYSEGFSGAKDLASKMVSLFLLSRQLLSQQQVCASMWGDGGGGLLTVPT